MCMTVLSFLFSRPAFPITHFTRVLQFNNDDFNLALGINFVNVKLQSFKLLLKFQSPVVFRRLL